LPVPRDLRRVDLGEDLVVLSFELEEARLPGALTPAEREVVRGVCDGKSNGAIARERGCSVHTVANILRGVYEKLRVNSRAELARKIRDGGHAPD